MTSDRIEPPTEFPGPFYRLCKDPNCPDAWAYKQGEIHYHYVEGP